MCLRRVVAGPSVGCSTEYEMRIPVDARKEIGFLFSA